ncbi:MAG: NAD(P)/FAD-dependent oxidoreductase, partial [Lachnospiraceae bacterium]|nr:NAD(P)/FAD-dependent oxidoreductase [Lachnospiraceae bacterium]
QLSRLASRALYDGKKCEARINFLSYMDMENIQAGSRTAGSELQYTKIFDKSIEDFSYKTVEEFLSGMVHKKIAAVVCKQNGIASGATVGQTGAKKVYDCIRMLIDFRVKITAPNSFDNAQVCCGGVPLEEVDENFASCKCKDIYIVGELLDCDGICGGYNLQWAWATGAIAGMNAAKG